MHVDKLILKDTNEEVLAHNNDLFPHSSYYVEPKNSPVEPFRGTGIRMWR